MTGEEKRKLLKEQMKADYKRDLQKRKEFLDDAKRLRHSHKLNEAVSGLVSGLEDDSDDWINQLNQESALSEAKMEMMLDNESSTTKEIDKLAKQAEEEKFSAEQLLKQMKREMGLLPEEEETPEEKPVPPKKQLGDF
jgi:DNA polymerase III delta prime subunit